MTPLYDELAEKYHYDTLLGWAFEDGPCYCYGYSRSGYDDMGTYYCNCSRPWSEAWDKLCDALQAVGWGHDMFKALNNLFGGDDR